MLFSLCLKNIKKSIKDYSIYFFTLVIAVCIFYIFNSMDQQTSMMTLTSSKHAMIKTLVMLLGYVSVFVSIILGFLIIFSNNFLIRRRKKEIGLYLTLGMSKRKVSTILVIETIVVGLCSLAVGLLLGVGLSQFLSIFTAKLFEVDMKAYEFVFSSNALFKTILYFGIIFVLVMIFNIISLSRYKLIDLLNANKKNEQVKIRNKYVTFISFFIAMSLLVYAYKLLFDGTLFNMNNNTIIMIVCGALGTFFLFFSLSGFLLKLFQINKKVYYKGLNMFVLKQVNSRINTSVISTTIISLMLLLTIGILSGSMSLASAFNGGIKENNLIDFTIFSKYTVYEKAGINNATIDLEKLSQSEDFNKYVSDYKIYTTYSTNEVSIGSLIRAKEKKQIIKDFGGNVQFDTPVSLMGESDYNSLMKLFDKDKYIYDLKDDEYLELANVDQIEDYYAPALKEKNVIDLNESKSHPAKDEIIEVALQNYNGSGNEGIIVVSDYLLKNIVESESILVGNYVKSNNVSDLEDRFLNYLSKNDASNILTRTKLQMEASSIGIKAILTFIGLYLGIIFAISSATILAIGQLSESSDNKNRFKILKQIGADDKMIRRALFTQIGIAFLFPLAVALFHSFFGLRELNGIIKLLGNLDLTSNIILTAVFIVLVYGGYLLATYLCSKNIIKE